MAYKVHCDGYPLLDMRSDELIIFDPNVKLEVNTAGEASFLIYSDHPYYYKLKKLKSLFEVSDDSGVIFRGRMTGDTVDFDKGKAVDLEGVMAFFNDSVVRPFSFPEDFLNAPDYITAAKSGNVIAFFLNWLISQHNEQVSDFQRLKMGVVTVTDPNNYLYRSSSDYKKTWETLKSALFGSALGGYLCPRYEADGTYIDYLAEFDKTNAQPIQYGENLLDLKIENDAGSTYTAAIPKGATPEGKPTVTIAGLDDGEINLDIVKQGEIIYSKSGVENYGWIFAPVSETTWEDVTVAENLLTKSVDWLENVGIMLSSTITASAVDLHLSDAQIQSLRIYRNVNVYSDPHGLKATYPITKLEIPLLKPQSTKITVGATRQTLTEQTGEQAETIKGFQNQLVEIGKVMKESDAKLEEELTETFNSQIKQLADSISLEVIGSLGSEASITLSANGKAQAFNIDLSEVRKAFANDPTAITISAGIITFNSGTIVINSTNFQVDSGGNITATNADIMGKITATSGRIGSEDYGWTIAPRSLYFGKSFAEASVFLCTGSGVSMSIAGSPSQDGWVFKAGSKFGVTKDGNLYCTSANLTGSLTTTSGLYEVRVTSGGLHMYYGGELCGRITSELNTNTKGMHFFVEHPGKFIMFRWSNSDTQSSGIAYVVNNGWSSNYDEINLFMGSTRFCAKTYLHTYTYATGLYMQEGYFMKSCDSEGKVLEEMLGYSDDMVKVGSVGCATMLRGTSVYLKNTSTTVTSDRNAKNSIEALPDAYETVFDNISPVRFRYNEGTSGRYHVGYIAQDVEAALTAAGLSTMDFAGFVDIKKTGNLGLMYDEFIAMLHLKIKRLEQRIAALETN